MNHRYAVKWTSQSQGSETEKVGDIVTFIPRGTSGYAFLPVGVKKSHIKFADKSTYERVLIQVKSGANKNIDYYYAPSRSVLEKQGNSEVINEFINS